eukprot:TRINITY_DN14748_c0_g1_i8.p1 TRINITY_DN14748_c0_g1~~TRINITY_DN14748_c0_g1_i8.p1  ORF type:complete len:485 (+),score=136.61 TRINITY_DN14748_c0_g1_i8:50-1504(+)
MDDEVPPLTGLQAESQLAMQIQNEIKKKLQAEYSHAGTPETMSSVLPEYIKAMVCNAKPKKQVVNDLELFLKEAAPGFVDWLWNMLANWTPNRTHSAFEQGDDEEMEDEGGKEENKDRRKKDSAAYPSARGFRNALQMATKENEKRERRFTKREDRERDRTDRDRERDKEREKERDRDRDRDRERRRDRDRDRDRRYEREEREPLTFNKKNIRSERLREEWDQNLEEERPKKRFSRLTKEEPVATTRFRITDNQGAGDLAKGVRLDVLPNGNELDRALLSNDTDTASTKFTITMDRINPSDIPSISHYSDIEAQQAQQPLEEGYEHYNAWGKGTWGKGVKGAPAPGRGGWTWTGGNMTLVPGQPSASTATPGRGRAAPPMYTIKSYEDRKKWITGKPGRGSSNLVWQNPTTMTEEDKKVASAAIQAKIDAPLSYSYSYSYSSGAGRGSMNRTWVNPAVSSTSAPTTPATTPAAPPAAAAQQAAN